MTASLIRLAFDSGWSHGDPGDGRLRFDSPNIAGSSCICVNARCAQEMMLDQLVPSWGIGDVLVVERAGLTINRIVAWIIGPITHGGSYFRIPVKVRSVRGSFAAHDELLLRHQGQESTELHGGPVDAGSHPEQPTVESSETVAPPALPAFSSQQPVTPVALPKSTNSPAKPSDLSQEALLAEVDALHGIIAELLNDKTEVYAVETNQ